MTTGRPEGLGDVFIGLADITRRRILDALATRGEATASALSSELPVSRQAVMKHLAILHSAGLVTDRRTGREVRYAVSPGRLNETARWIARVAADWDHRLTTIKALAEGDRFATAPRRRG